MRRDIQNQMERERTQQYDYWDNEGFEDKNESFGEQKDYYEENNSKVRDNKRDLERRVSYRDQYQQ